jgi:hypothetical protein
MPNLLPGYGMVENYDNDILEELAVADLLEPLNPLFLS